jgi:hypothetical protein
MDKDQRFFYFFDTGGASISQIPVFSSRFIFFRFLRDALLSIPLRGVAMLQPREKEGAFYLPGAVPRAKWRDRWIGICPAIGNINPGLDKIDCD